MIINNFFVLLCFAAGNGDTMLSCHDVAKYLLAQGNTDEAGDLISNLKLQKLAYYSQGFHLAVFDKPLFPERIEAWMHGPVVPDLYNAYKQHGSSSIPYPTDLDFKIYDDQVKDLLDEVWQVYGQFSAWKLREMTHEEPPWKSAYTSGNGSVVIEHDSLRKYFKTQLISE